MSIEAINESLLRAIGVGVALVRGSDGSFAFYNSSFAEWFGEAEEGTTLLQVIDGLTSENLHDVASGASNFSGEFKVKRKRRTLVIAVTISAAQANDEVLLVVECQNITRIRELEAMIETYSNMVERNTRELEREKERVEKLLLNLMPRSVYEEFKTFGVVTPQLFDNVAVVMLDFVDFTDFAARTDPTVTLGELNDIFTAFDRISEQFGCERIKTIGDAYLAVAGMPDPTPDAALTVARCAIRFIRYLERRNESHQHKWRARIGLGRGAAVGSVVGIQKYVYDVFGPAVNMAARLQILAKPMTVVAPESMTYELVDEFQIDELGNFDVKGLGEMDLIEINSLSNTARVRF
ncbi:adenylate/guanylate cyclase domain-containing protein [Ruegeria marina]|uniref:Adenylate cyclase, class 3 n=1 Tax=Ruegeria marina TaxID=639004 RepID=A0A1G6VRP9_9RHOB|nr:adenylate/guanylate cyclase domain-containing protein [Ruegeria marina]SDD56248.1 Adenylate cyclase, class 3 [Ruegeria marina]